jgi:hypothetical protein
MSRTSLVHVVFVLAVAAAASWPAARAFAKDVVFMEDFNGSSASWVNFNSSAFLNYSAAGGPDGGSYASGPRNFNGLIPGNQTIILRARDDFDSSGDAFTRDWLADDITDVNLWVRHDYTGPLTYVMRVAAEGNFPGIIYTADDGPVPANQWTQINFDVSRFSSSVLGDEGGTYSQTYQKVGFVTFGVIVPSGALNTPYTFDIDKVAILSPEPASAAMSLVGLVGFAFTHRRRRSTSPAV